MSPCSRVLDSLGEPLSAELEAHVAGCAECRELVEGFGALEGLGGPRGAEVPALERAREEALKELAAHPRATPWWREVAVLVGVYALVTVLGALVLTRVGLVGNTASTWVLAGLAVLLLVAMVGGAVVALAPMRKAAWGLVGTSAAVVGLSVVLGGSGLVARGFLAGCLGCARAHMMLSTLPLVAALVLLRRSAYHPARAVAAGLSGGAVGLLLLHLHCPDGSTAHLALSHVGPWLLLGGLTLLVRARLSTRSHAP
ncbi:MAG TPA: NrsF family protein [Myxococcaceae bacterium]|nr:NrsF family protein [Myxococcaceae bacterium]